MKFICTRENLAQGLGRAVPVAGRNTQLPVLEHILLRLRDGVLHCTSTDLEVGVHTTVPGKVEKEGACTVAARKLMEYIQQLPSKNPITLEQKGTVFHVRTTGFQARFPTGNDDDFPLLPKLSRDRVIPLSAASLCRALSRVAFSAAREQTRPEMHSVFMRGSADTVTVAATDSFRLAEDTLSLGVQGDDFIFLLPLATAQEIIRLFSDMETVDIIPHENHILLAAEGIELSSRLVDGNYPDYQQIIPRQHLTRGVIVKDELIRALKTLTVFLPRDSRRIQIAIKPDKDSALLSVEGGEAGEGTVNLDFDGDGQAVEMLFNIQYLLEGIQHIPGDRVNVKLAGNSDPALFVPDQKGERYTYVVMPIQAQ